MTDSPVQWREALRSTQDEAHGLAAAGAAHGTAVAARVQSAGRGTRGREWVSEEGGLWLSVVCRPDAGAATEVIGLRVGLALADLLDTIIAPTHRVAIKWPNDLYLAAAKAGRDPGGGALAGRRARLDGDRRGTQCPQRDPALALEVLGEPGRSGFTTDPVELAVPVTPGGGEGGARRAHRSMRQSCAPSRSATGCGAGRSRSPHRVWPRGSPGTGRLLVRTLAGTATEVTRTGSAGRPRA